jgi:hypothetical protein
MGLREQFLFLPAAGRRLVHERLVLEALARWKAYADAQGEIRYRETVTGTAQVVDAGLPGDALASVRSGQDTAAVDDRYGEPLAALQDDDLSFPEPVEFAYYAIYNFFRRYGLHEEVDDWLLVSQAGSSEEDQRKWAGTLTTAIEDAARPPRG